MSHFTTIAVQIKNGESLHQILQELGYAVEQDTLVRGYMGNKTKADYVIRQLNGYDLGFRRQGEEYELIADFWGAQIDQAKFLQPILQRYAHQTLMATVQEHNFTVEQQESLPDGTLRVVVGHWI
jgi:hypothetical protein